MSIGTLPTLTEEFLKTPGWITEENRYQALSNMVEARGELVRISVADQESFTGEFSDIAPEAAYTSMQLHLQVSPHLFADA